MDHVEFQWLYNEGSRKEALQYLLGCSGQLLKKHFSSVELGRPIRAKDLVRLPLDLVNHMKINPVYVGPRISVIKETKDYIAVHKPSLIHCHPLVYTDQDTVLNFLAQENKQEALKVNSSNYDRGLLFRLDYETSGVLVLAKTDEFHAKMRHDFEKQMKRKLYLVTVEGDFNQEGLWTHYLKGSGAKGAKQKVSTDPFPESHSGSLEVKKLAITNNKSLLLVSLKTGLRHQIRAQLSFLGFPILGDELYGGAKAERLFLHAWRYEWDEVIQDDEVDLFDPLLLAAMPKEFL
jgi:23S rRNA pseudouridine1911/1915/1917 synthase